MSALIDYNYVPAIHRFKSFLWIVTRRIHGWLRLCQGLLQHKDGSRKAGPNGRFMFQHIGSIRRRGWQKFLTRCDSYVTIGYMLERHDIAEGIYLKQTNERYGIPAGLIGVVHQVSTDRAENGYFYCGTWITLAGHASRIHWEI